MGGVIKAMMARAPNERAEAVQHAAEELEVYCNWMDVAGNVLSCSLSLEIKNIMPLFLIEN